MNAFSTRSFERVAVATVLSLGLSASAVSIAAASTQSSKATSHTSVTAKSSIAFQGTVTSLPAGYITVVNAKGASKTFTVLSTTRILRAANVKNTAALAVGERVEVRALTSAPLVATSINILAAKANATVAFQGTVTSLPAGYITVVNAKGASKTFAIATTTKVLRALKVKNTAKLAVGERAEVRVMTSAPLVATSINILSMKK